MCLQAKEKGILGKVIAMNLSIGIFTKAYTPEGVGEEEGIVAPVKVSTVTLRVHRRPHRSIVQADR